MGKVLKCYRARLLSRFRSLHEAFAGQQRIGSWELPLGPKELRHTLARITEGDEDALFASAGMNWHTGMSLATFFHKLVGVSAESLFGELRSRLACAGLWHHDSFSLKELAYLI